MLDAHRALLHARSTRGAVPQLVFGDDVADQLGGQPNLGQTRLIGRGQLAAPNTRLVDTWPGGAGEETRASVHIRADLDDQLPRLQRFAGVESRTEVEAASATHTRVEVDELFPVEVVQFGDAEVLLFLDICNQWKRCSGVSSAQEDVRRASDDVRQLRDGDVHQQRRIGQHVRPPRDRVRAGQNRRIDPVQGQRKWIRDPVDRRGFVARG